MDYVLSKFITTVLQSSLNREIPYLKWKDHEEIMARILRGEIGCTPTETVAGILGLPETQNRINDIKKGPDTKPLACIIGKKEQCLQLWGTLPPHTDKLAAFWPGPLTLIAGEGEGRALRMPAIPELLSLLKKTGPLVCTSANFSGEEPASSPRKIPEKLLSQLDFLIDEHPATLLGTASTILLYKNTSWHCLRQGSLAEKEWKKALIS